MKVKCKDGKKRDVYNVYIDFGMETDLFFLVGLCVEHRAPAMHIIASGNFDSIYRLAKSFREQINEEFNSLLKDHALGC